MSNVVDCIENTRSDGIDKEIELTIYSIRNWVDKMIFKPICDSYITKDDVFSSPIHDMKASPMNLSGLLVQLLVRIGRFLNDSNYNNIIHRAYLSTTGLRAEVFITDSEIVETCIHLRSNLDVSTQHLNQLDLILAGFNDFHTLLFNLCSKDTNTDTPNKSDVNPLETLRILYPVMTQEKDWVRNSTLKTVFTKKMVELYTLCIYTHRAISKLHNVLTCNGKTIKRCESVFQKRYRQVQYNEGYFDLVELFPFNENCTNYTSWKDSTFQIGSQLKNINVTLKVVHILAGKLETSTGNSKSFKTGEWCMFRDTTMEISSVLQQIIIRLPN